MKRFFAKTVLAALVLAGFFSAAAGAPKQTQDIYSPVILGWEKFSLSRPIQVMEDGGGLQVISISGDLTHNGEKGQRYFLRREAVDGVGFPDGSQYYDLVAYNENGEPTTRRVLAADRSVFRSYFTRWSIDGKRVAYFGQRYAGDTIIEDGIFVGEVRYDADGAPDLIENERLAVTPVLGTGERARSFLSWSPDNLRVTYSTSNWSSGSRQDAIYVAYLPPLGLSSADFPPNCKVELTSSSIQMRPTFSPVLDDNRLAFLQNTKGGSACFINHIFIAEVPFGYCDGSSLLTATQITNQRNAKVCQMDKPEWSPDGIYLAFDAWDTGLRSAQIYKIKSDGSGKKAIKLTNSRKQSYSVLGWRR